MVRVAFITGITGQDGSYLTEFLLEKKYDVWGMIRRASNINTERIDHLFHNEHLYLRYGDLIDQFAHRYWSKHHHPGVPTVLCCAGRVGLASQVHCVPNTGCQFK